MRQVNILYGPPASGKTSIMGAMGGELSYVSVGDEFRRELRDGTALGSRLNAYLSTVREYPACLIGKLVTRAIERDNPEAVMLDGFPKYEREVPILGRIISDTEAQPGIMVELCLSLNDAFERTRQRFICSECGIQQITATQCVKCGSDNLLKRDDDDDIFFKRRYNDYIEASNVVIPVLKEMGFRHVPLESTPENSPEVLAAQIKSELERAKA